MLGTKSKLFALFFIPLVLYLGLYSFNRRTGWLDSAAEWTGLEVVGWIVVPGDWIRNTTREMWRDYVALWTVRQENKQLRRENRDLRIRAMRLQSLAAEAERLRALLELSPPGSWACTGARVAGERMSPSDALQTVLLSKGRTDEVRPGMPAITSKGLAGQVLKASPHFSKLLLLTDANSKIPVVAKEHRIKAILSGTGPEREPRLEYVARNAPLEEGEILVTSGLGGMFPKGIPVGRVTGIEQPEHTLFRKVTAEPLVDPRGLEEVLLLRKPRPIRPDLFSFDPAWPIPID